MKLKKSKGGTGVGERKRERAVDQIGPIGAPLADLELST